MPKIKELILRFRNPPDAVQNKIRVRPASTPGAYDEPSDVIASPPPDVDGYTRIPFANIPQTVGLEGTFDIHVTAVDAAGNESDFLEIDNQTFDISAPDAPTDGAVV